MVFHQPNSDSVDPFAALALVKMLVWRSDEHILQQVSERSYQVDYSHLGCFGGYGQT